MTFTLHDLADLYVESVTAHHIKRNDHSCFQNRWPKLKTKLKLKHLFFFFFFFLFGLSVAQITHDSTYAWLYYHHSQPFFFFFFFFFFFSLY